MDLVFYNLEFMKFLTWSDISVAATFSSTCDDLLTLNNSDYQACIGQIYSPELEPKKMTESHDSCSYLDLNLNAMFFTDV